MQQQTGRSWGTAEHYTSSGWKACRAAWQNSAGSPGVGRRHCTAVNQQDCLDTHSCRRTWLTTGCDRMLVHSRQGWASVGTTWVGARGQADLGRRLVGRGLLSDLFRWGAEETSFCSKLVDRLTMRGRARCGGVRWQGAGVRRSKCRYA